MSAENLDIEVGRLDGRLSSLEGRVSELYTALIEINKKLDTIALAVAGSKGGNDLIRFLGGLLLGASGWVYMLLHWGK